MERAVAQAEAHFIYRLQTVGGFGGKSDQLNAYNVLRGDPGFFADDLDAVSIRVDRQRFAQPRRECLRFDRRVVLSVVPQRPAGAGAAGLGAGRGVVMRADRSRLPEVGPDPAFVFPAHRAPRSARTACRSARSSTTARRS